MSEREMRVSHALLRPVHLGATSCCPGPPVVHPNIGWVAYPGRPTLLGTLPRPAAAISIQSGRGGLGVGVLAGTNQPRTLWQHV